MGVDVYVWPRDILQAIYDDLQAGSKAVRGLEIVHSTEVIEGHETEKVEVVFDTCTRMSRSGRINLEAIGMSRVGVVEAERDAVVGIVEALRTTHSITPADYNHVLILEDRHIYNVLRAALFDFCRYLNDLEQVVRNSHSSLERMLGRVSKLIGGIEVDDEHHEEIVSFSALHASLSQYSAKMEREINHARQLVQIEMDRDVEPEAQRRFDATVPMTMIIDWDASFPVLKTILDQAKKQLNLQVSDIRVCLLDDGQFEASVDVTVDPIRLHGPELGAEEAEYYREPRAFTSTPYSSELGAKARVVYKAIEFVSDSLHCNILDLNYELYCHQQNYCARHDAKMKEILGCGYRLERALRLCEELYLWGTVELNKRTQRSEFNATIFDVISLFGDQLKDDRKAFRVVWEYFLSQKDHSDGILPRKFKII